MRSNFQLTYLTQIDYYGGEQKLISGSAWQPSLSEVARNVVINSNDNRTQNIFRTQFYSEIRSFRYVEIVYVRSVRFKK
jgi:hypothetical protein